MHIFYGPAVHPDRTTTAGIDAESAHADLARSHRCALTSMDKNPFKRRRMAGLIKVVDDFYADPDMVRQTALRSEYRTSYPSYGYRSRRGFLTDETVERIKTAFGFESITLYHEMTGSTCFYHSFGQGQAQESFHVHTDVDRRADDLDYSLVLYLTPGAPGDSGTAICKHKRTGIWQEPRAEDALRLGLSGSEISGLLDAESEDRSKWDIIDVSQNVYNRAVLFPAHWCHTGLNYFGDSIDNGRLYQAFFFRGYPDVFESHMPPP